MKLKIYVFGNEDVNSDAVALKVAKRLANKAEFIKIKPNQDLPFDNGESVIIMDVVDGIDKVTLFQSKDLDKLSLPPRSSAHDFDLSFQLKYLKKLGRLGKVTIIGLPMDKKFDYNLIHSTFKKLVAQDMHGS